MKNEYLLGLDVGTQSAKIVVFNTDGDIVCEGKQALRKMTIPAPSLAEHPDDDLWDATQLAFKRAMERFNELGLDAGQIKAMGICIIRCCRVLMRKNGELAHPVINWMDKRLNYPYEHLPEYGKVDYVTTTSGYITHRLTGESKDTCANYIGWWPMDNDRWDWSDDPQLWKNCNLERSQVFDVVKPGEILGHLRDDIAERFGLPIGLPVVATAHDKAVEALGAGSLEPGVALISLGTYIGAMVHGKENAKNTEHYWPFQASLPDSYLYECMGVRRGMWTVSWFRDQFGAAALAEAEDKGVCIEELLSREAAQVPPGSDGLVTIHDWAAPSEAEFRKGAMIGFDGRHTRGHMFRSLLEGIAYTLKNHMDKMTEEQGQPLTKLVISGGGANSDVFMQIFADVFGIPSTRNKMNGSVAIGCAINAGMAVGCFDSAQQAIERLVKSGDVYQPNLEAHKFYSRLNERVYSQVSRHLDPMLEELSPLVD
ncbi:sugar kinase [Photobacterium gaetbulicola]|uniref:Sugar kinase n=1 Tax=Photobacterium gaetbulicola TaxID=1295392 RepID=A0A0B9H3A2_9GAMM|nr:FGGY-family carbohydrate kinase [Photobacterium gaetbulicola]KHT63367.1 sugar kinase [Photobacterium gaetbulicola]